MRTIHLGRVLVAMSACMALLVAACGGEEPTATPQPTATPEPTATPQPTVSPQPSPTEEPTSEPSPTATPSDGNGGDPEAGAEVFEANGCSGCHSTGDDTVVGPGLAGVWDRAGERVSDMSAEEYVRESIRDPDAYIVDGFSEGTMQTFTESQISESELQDLMAYLRTL
ncbi:MAG: c-type cytochrome [Chloroflexota bacterium]